MYRVGRYDIKGKEHLKLLEKYYLADVGLRYYLLGTQGVDQGRLLENVVYLELLRRDYRVYVGKFGNAEVDFVARSYDGNTEYYQVSWSVREENTLKRELEPINFIADHNPKILLTMDNDPPVLTTASGRNMCLTGCLKQINKIVCFLKKQQCKVLLKRIDNFRNFLRDWLIISLKQSKII